MNFIAQSEPTMGNDLSHGDARSGEVPILVQYWDSVYRRKTLIIAIVAGCILVAFVLTAMMTPQYSATSRIEISRKQGNVTNVETLEPDDLGKSDEFYQTQYALLRARSLADRVVRQLNLATDEKFFSSYGVELNNADGNNDTPNAANLARRQRVAADLLLANVTIAPIRNSSLVDIEFRSPDPQMSAKVANAWVAQFIASNLDRRFASTSDARSFLEQRLATLRQRLEDSERALVTYASNKEIVTLSRNTDAEGRTTNERTLASADLEALNTVLSQATAERIQAGSEAQGAMSAEVVNNPTVAGLRLRRAELSSQYAQLMAQFEPGYPTAVALQSQIRDLDRRIAQEEGRVTGARQTRYADAVQREKTLQARVDSLKARLIGEQRNTIQYNIFQREVDTNRELYNGLLQRYKEIGVAGVGTNNVAVVDAARVPSHPSSPNLPLNIMLGILFGLALSVSVVFVLEQIDQSLKDPADVPDLLKLPLLGTIPSLSEGVLDSIEDKKSIASEAYLSVQTNLTFLTDHGVPKALLMTSTRPSEGKSSSTLALAHTLARTGRRVVVVDADMRKPSVHRYLGDTNEFGLSNYLAGEDNINSLVHVSPIEGLYVMTAGPQPPNAAELLSTDRMRKLIQSLTQQYDHVLVDAPPVLGFADIPLLAGTVEGILYVVQANGPKVRAIHSALQRLRTSKANIFGIILTQLDVGKKSRGYGYYGYSYSYEYGVGPDSNRKRAPKDETVL